MYAFWYLVGLMGVAAIYALIATALMRFTTKKLIAYRPTRKTVFSSCMAGYLVVAVIGMVLSRAFEMKVQTPSQFWFFLSIQSAIALPLYTGFHLGLVRTRHDHRPTLFQALVLAFVQLFVGIFGAASLWHILNPG